jgi:hypothetical protein
VKCRRIPSHSVKVSWKYKTSYNGENPPKFHVIAWNCSLQGTLQASFKKNFKDFRIWHMKHIKLNWYEHSVFFIFVSLWLFKSNTSNSENCKYSIHKCYIKSKIFYLSSIKYLFNSLFSWNFVFHNPWPKELIIFFQSNPSGNQMFKIVFIPHRSQMAGLVHGDPGG